MMSSPPDWAENSRYILHEIKRLNDIHGLMEDRIHTLMSKVATLETKSTINAALTAVVVSAIISGIVAYIVAASI